MKILHIVAGNLNGGAAKGAYWLHSGLCEVGVQSKILVNAKSPKDERIISVASTFKNKIFLKLYALLDSLIPQLYKKKKALFSTGLFGFDFTKTAAYQEADIINLHWINGGFINIKHLSKIKKPLVWTIRDMWPFTGGCHLSLGCERYKTSCGSCVQLNSKYRLDLSKWVLHRKRRYLPKQTKIVAISQWVAEQARESTLLKHFDIRTISNCIDMDVFFPVNKIVARKALAIQTKKKIILLGSINLEESYKGFEKYIQAIQYLDKHLYYLCFFGNISNINILERLGFEYHSFGFLQDFVSLRLLYSAADVFVAPSTMEPFGKTVIEAMACATPAVCFNATGTKDIITHQVDGYKAKPFVSEDIAKGIRWVLNNDYHNNLRSAARRKVVNLFDNKIIAAQYVDLYEQLLNKDGKHNV